jgi:hypothetical protein
LALLFVLLGALPLLAVFFAAGWLANGLFVCRKR